MRSADRQYLRRQYLLFFGSLLFFYAGVLKPKTTGEQRTAGKQASSPASAEPTVAAAKQYWRGGDQYWQEQQRKACRTLERIPLRSPSEARGNASLSLWTGCFGDTIEFRRVLSEMVQLSAFTCYEHSNKYTRSHFFGQMLCLVVFLFLHSLVASAVMLWAKPPSERWTSRKTWDLFEDYFFWMSLCGMCGWIIFWYEHYAVLAWRLNLAYTQYLSGLMTNATAPENSMSLFWQASVLPLVYFLVLWFFFASTLGAALWGCFFGLLLSLRRGFVRGFDGFKVLDESEEKSWDALYAGSFRLGCPLIGWGFLTWQFGLILKVPLIAYLWTAPLVLWSGYACVQHIKPHMKRLAYGSLGYVKIKALFEVVDIALFLMTILNEGGFGSAPTLHIVVFWVNVAGFAFLLPSFFRLLCSRDRDAKEYKEEMFRCVRALLVLDLCTDAPFVLGEHFGGIFCQEIRSGRFNRYAMFFSLLALLGTLFDLVQIIRVPYGSLLLPQPAVDTEQEV